MRPQRCRAASTIAASVVSLVTSASNATHSPARLPRHRHRLLGGSEVAVDGQHLGPLLGEAHHRGAAVAHAFARRLAGADHDGDLVPETHMNLGCVGFIASLIEMASQARALWTLH